MLREIPAAAREERRVSLDPTVKVLGVVTLLNDLSSEVAVRTLPLFLANVLGVKTGIIGLIEGLAESTATLLKIVSGYLADRSGKKKRLTVWGYGLSGFTKPLLFFATGWPLVLSVRVLDRVGKGIRSSPQMYQYPRFLDTQVTSVYSRQSRSVASAGPDRDAKEE